MKIFLLSTYFFIFFIHCVVAEEIKPHLTVMIPMRDGVELPTDLYFPAPEARDLPCILVRSPAGRQAYGMDIDQLAKEGYVVAIQKTRSALDLEGKTVPFITDGWGKSQDGYDTVEWLAQSPYTNGKIGTWGASAMGITQLLMAPSHPPHLKCQYILFAAASLYHHALFPGGQLLKHQAEGWLGHYAHDTGVLSYICQRPFYNEFWKQLNSLEMSHQVKVPAIHIGGWYDTFLQGTLTSFTSRQYQGGEGAYGQQKLVIGPWTHFWPLSQHFGDFEIPKEGLYPPVNISPKSWFDYYLKGISNNIENLAPVNYYVMGPFDGSPSSGNIWRTSPVWPVPAKQTAFYLTPDFHLQKVLSANGSTSYPYDPKETIPTIGGRNLFLESGPKDQRSIENRPDVLVFTSEKLTEDVEVTGPLSATLFLTSDRIDTDICLRLCDVYPDGRSVLISEGGYRLGVMCYQNKAKQAYQPHALHQVHIDLWATSLVFAKDHAIRVSISSSNYPRYEKNMNIGLLETNTGKFHSAKNTIYMGEDHPSHLLLPIVSREN